LIRWPSPFAVSFSTVSFSIGLLRSTIGSDHGTLLVLRECILDDKRMLVVGAIISPRGTREGFHRGPTNSVGCGGAHNTQIKQAGFQQRAGCAQCSKDLLTVVGLDEFLLHDVYQLRGICSKIFGR
jgi:hypothetical protein